MGNHTPGPWDYDKDSKEIFSCDEGHGCGWIALVGGNDSNGRRLPDEMRSANARLIAAAPELLEVARVAEAMLGGDDTGPDDEDMRDVWGKVRAAIAKAEGSAE